MLGASGKKTKVLMVSLFLLVLMSPSSQLHWFSKSFHRFVSYIYIHIHTLLLLLSCFSRVWLCATPWMAAPQYPVPGILQARTPEWVAISFSNAWKWKVKVKPLSRVRLFETPWTAAHQAPPSMGFSRQEYWSGLPSPSLIHTLGNWREEKHKPIFFSG